MKEITIDGVVYVPKEVKQEAKKWEPKGLVYATTGTTFDCHFRFQNYEMVEKAAKEMRRFNRLLAYKMEFCPGYEPDWNDEEKKYCVFYDTECALWCLDNYIHLESITVHFTKEVAEELVKKLNSGEVEL
jgi:hypothetical protein